MAWCMVCVLLGGEGQVGGVHCKTSHGGWIGWGGGGRREGGCHQTSIPGRQGQTQQDQSTPGELDVCTHTHARTHAHT